MKKIIFLLILLFSTSFISAQKTDVWYNKSTVKLIGTYINLRDISRLVIGKDSICAIDKTYKIFSCKKFLTSDKYTFLVNDNGKIVTIIMGKYKYQKRNYFTVSVEGIEEGPLYIIKELN